MNKLFLDDQLVESDSVSLPLLSRGLAFGYGVFETMKFIDGRPCFLGEHLERLRRGLEGARIRFDLDEGAIRERARRLFEAEGVQDGVFKIVISDVGESTQMAMFVRTKGMPVEAEIGRLRMSKVVKASEAFTSRNKSLNYMESVLELESAKAEGFTECVFRNEREETTECSVANLFFVKNGILNTPELKCGLLDGIVRRKVIEIAQERGVTVCEGTFFESDLLEASQVFLTSSGAGPRSVESFQSSDGKVSRYKGNVLPELRELYLLLEKEEAWSHDV